MSAMTFAPSAAGQANGMLPGATGCLALGEVI
jgi:hypothetical protein